MAYQRRVLYGPLFGDGGGQQDNTAAILAQQEENRRREQAAAQARIDQERTAAAAERVRLEEQAKMESAQREQDLQKQREDAAKQAAAQVATGPSVQFDNSKNAKLAAASKAGLPGFESISKKPILQNLGQGGFLGQSNTLISQGGFNQNQPGGRRYT